MDRCGAHAFLFTIGKFSIGLYLGKSDVGSAYGAAGSLAILLVWVYYSAQILLFGAEFTQVYANKAGAGIVPTHNAVAVDPEKAGSESPGVGAKDRTDPPGSLDGQRELGLHASGRILLHTVILRHLLSEMSSAGWE